MDEHSENFNKGKRGSKMVAVEEDAEFGPSQEQNQIYLYIGSNYSYETTEHRMKSLWQQTGERDQIEESGGEGTLGELWELSGGREAREYHCLCPLSL